MSGRPILISSAMVTFGNAGILTIQLSMAIMIHLSNKQLRNEDLDVLCEMSLHPKFCNQPNAIISHITYKLKAEPSLASELSNWQEILCIWTLNITVFCSTGCPKYSRRLIKCNKNNLHVSIKRCEKKYSIVTPDQDNGLMEYFHMQSQTLTSNVYKKGWRVMFQYWK